MVEWKAGWMVEQLAEKKEPQKAASLVEQTVGKMVVLLVDCWAAVMAAQWADTMEYWKAVERVVSKAAKKVD